MSSASIEGPVSGVIDMPRFPRGTAFGYAVLQFLATVYLTLVVSLLFWSYAPSLVGWTPRVVVTGSMMPVIQPGDVAVIGPAAPGPQTLPKDRVVLVRDPSYPTGSYLHRVLEYDASGKVITKGDANPTADVKPVSPEQIDGQLRLVVPLVGKPMMWLSEGRWLQLGALLVTSWLALLVMFSERRLGPLGSPGRGEPASAASREARAGRRH